MCVNCVQEPPATESRSQKTMVPQATGQRSLYVIFPCVHVQCFQESCGTESHPQKAAVPQAPRACIVYDILPCVRVCACVCVCVPCFAGGVIRNRKPSAEDNGPTGHWAEIVVWCFPRCACAIFAGVIWNRKPSAEGKCPTGSPAEIIVCCMPMCVCVCVPCFAEESSGTESRLQKTVVPQATGHRSLYVVFLCVRAPCFAEESSGTESRPQKAVPQATGQISLCVIFPCVHVPCIHDRSHPEQKAIRRRQMSHRLPGRDHCMLYANVCVCVPCFQEPFGTESFPPNMFPQAG